MLVNPMVIWVVACKFSKITENNLKRKGISTISLRDFLGSDLFGFFSASSWAVLAATMARQSFKSAPSSTGSHCQIQGKPKEFQLLEPLTIEFFKDVSAKTYVFDLKKLKN